MKTLSIYDAVNHIGTLPGDSFIQVYYNLNSGCIVISEDEEPDMNINIKICSGQPEKFFNALHTALFQMVTRND